MTRGNRIVSVVGPGGEVAREVRCAHTFFARLRGLIGRRRLGEDAGLWLRPCASVHTLGMRFAIDVLFLNRDQRVTSIAASVPPGRFFVVARGASSALELPAGTAARQGVAPGDRLCITARQSAENHKHITIE